MRASALAVLRVASSAKPRPRTGSRSGGRRFVAVGDGEAHGAVRGRRAPAAAGALANASGSRERSPSPRRSTAFPRRAAGRAGKSVEREHGLLDAYVPGRDLGRKVEVGDFSPSMIRQAKSATGKPIAFQMNAGARGRWVRLDHVQPRPRVYRELHVQQPDHAERFGRYRPSGHGLSAPLPTERGGAARTRVPGAHPAPQRLHHPVIHIASPSQIASTSTSTESSRKRST